jgi:hypothetical protein
MAALIVFLLCTLTSLACAILLLRGYRRSRVRLLLWSGLCFVGLAFNNALLIVDRHLLPAADLRFLPTVAALIAICCLLYGLIWDEAS